MEQVQEKIFSSLHISKKRLLDEMSLLLAKQQISEFRMEIEYLEKKYKINFNKFNDDVQKQTASYEMENDWMKWKFAVESLQYWKNLLQEKI
ncbi:MAG: hypothetical protein LC660_14095 [Desulfobacteraceae bacterium]|nr:hypothetical protein [Desulfobacteraceae bacterium]